MHDFSPLTFLLFVPQGESGGTGPMGTPGPMVSQLSHDLSTDEMNLLAAQKVPAALSFKTSLKMTDKASFISQMQGPRGMPGERGRPGPGGAPVSITKRRKNLTKLIPATHA